MSDVLLIIGVLWASWAFFILMNLDDFVPLDRFRWDDVGLVIMLVFAGPPLLLWFIVSDIWRWQRCGKARTPAAPDRATERTE